jgi:hypothetical protein
MLTLQQTFSDQPVWQQQVRKRLAVSMGIAVLLLAALLLLVKFSPLPALKNSMIEVRLVAEPEPEPIVEPIETLEFIDPVELLVPAKLAQVVEPVGPVEPQATDWYAEAESAVEETVTAANNVDSMHPAFDEKRRLAAINFRPSQGPVKKPIWENVETDQMGRKVLVSGDCYRVLEDWRATYHEIHRQLGQYITYCNANTDKPMDVAWVEGTREGYAYLEYPDGEIPQDQLIALTRRSSSLSESLSQE